MDMLNSCYQPHPGDGGGGSALPNMDPLIWIAGFLALWALSFLW